MLKEHTQTFLAHIKYCLKRAERARDRWAIQDREFHVGAAFYVLTEDGQFEIIDGANVMVRDPQTREVRVRICAEVACLHACDPKEVVRVIGVVVVGPQQADDESGIDRPTLHPCGACRRMFRDSSLFDDGTLFITVNADNTNIREEHTLGDILKLHNGTSGD